MNSTEWQDALLYHAAWGNAAEVFALVGIDDFDPGERMNLAELMERLVAAIEKMADIEE